VACELPALLLALLLHAFLFSFLALLAGINSCTQDTWTQAMQLFG
jgi:hypothetical protein